MALPGACFAAEASLHGIWPKTLRPGALIQLVAPAGPLDPERMERARLRLEQLGCRVRAQGIFTHGRVISQAVTHGA
jgi:muramoyltetrapeptide carboxypeptidase LdcA involved in peptidoglycan recycling